MFRSEYPRPNFIRKNWRSLNGRWQFEIGDGNKKTIGRYLGEPLSGQIEVPFAPGVPLSGVNLSAPIKSVWYKKTFELTKEEAKGAPTLNFGAVDYRAEVYINGILAAIHKGGYTPFSVNIKNFVKEGENTVTVNALDDIGDQTIPCGLQGKTPGVQPVTGIWQSVFLEFTDENHIAALRVTPYVKEGVILLQGILSNAIDGYISVTISLEDKEICRYRYKAEKNFNLSAPLKALPRLWDIYNGALYDIEIVLTDSEGNEKDYVKTYTAFRTVEARDGRIFINGKDVFIKAVEDYGVYPGGGLTAAYADTIKQDLAAAVSSGFNAIRPLGRIAEPLYRYYADKLGLLVICDNNFWGVDTGDAAGIGNAQREWNEAVYSHFGNPSAVFMKPVSDDIMSGAFASSMYAITQKADPSRLTLTGANIAYQGDVAEIRLSSNNTQEILSRLIERKNGAGIPPKIFKKLTGVMDDTAFTGLPFIASGIGINAERWGIEQEKALLREYENIKAAIASTGAAGYIYDSLYDIPGLNSGIFTFDRDNKFSREGFTAFQRINY